MTVELCNFDELPEGEARGFSLPTTNVFAVKTQGKVHCYLNRCPHLGIPLQWEEHGFLDSENLYIKCSTHGALFVKESGECIQGPCRGEHLWEITTEIVAGKILIDESELPATPAPE